MASQVVIAVVTILVGFVVLAWGADRFVTGAAALARKLGVSPLLVGLTIVALGTSAPELVVTIFASWQGKAGLAIGNVVGSNIANIGLVLGVIALIRPLQVNSNILKREYPILFFIMLLTWLLLANGYFSRIDGVVLLVLLVLVMGWMVVIALQSKSSEPMSSEFGAEIPVSMSYLRASVLLLLGMILLPIGAELIVKGAVVIAKALGISDFVIGLTIIAVGTSLPEIAASLAGVIKKEYDIALGNIIGSNLFNLLFVLPFAGLIAPGVIDHLLLWRDMPVMLILTLTLFLFAYGFHQSGRISRFEGALLLLGYVIYVGILFAQV